MLLGTMYLIFLFVIITFRLCLHLLRLPHVSKCYSTQVEPVKQNIMKTFSAQELQISSEKQRAQKQRKLRGKKSTLRTRTTTQPAHDPHNARSLGPARSERGGALLRLGVGSPHKIFALARCMQHEMTVYHLRISSDGSSS